MLPLVIRGHVWGVIRVSPGDPLLVDRTGVPRLATTDPTSRVIRVSSAVPPDMLDRVLLHEATHAIMEEAGINDLLRQLPCGPVLSEETLAWFLESHAVEAVDAVGRMLGRMVCVDDTCLGG